MKWGSLQRFAVSAALSMLLLAGASRTYAEAGVGAAATGKASLDAKTLRIIPRVRTTDDFMLAMKQHITKVRLLAVDIVRQFPERFPDVTEQMVAELIEEVHDHRKLDRPLAESLFKIWGTRLSRLPEAEAKAGRAAIDELNLLESADEEEFFRRKGWTEAQKRQVSQVEALADRLERALAPLSREEFGEARMIPASEFSDDELTRQHRTVLKHYEDLNGKRYESAVRGHHFEDVIRHRMLSPACVGGALQRALRPAKVSRGIRRHVRTPYGPQRGVGRVRPAGHPDFYIRAGGGR